jgi:hypothetical protein
MASASDHRAPRPPTAKPFRSTGFPVGLVAASLAFAAVARLREAQFLSWGWRLTFLASILLVALGYYVRKTVAESPI